jgi:hypothetical protein
MRVAEHVRPLSLRLPSLESRLFMTSSRTPVLWLLGATGTGKSNTSYFVFSRLWRSGTPTARVDLDDIGMCHPAPEDDEDNFRVKADALAALWEVFRSHGATCLVVSGGVNLPQHLDIHTRIFPEAQWTLCRLRIGADERRRRVKSRGEQFFMSDEDIEHNVSAGQADEAELDRQAFFDHVIDTDGLDPRAVADLVLETTGWPHRTEGLAQE